jgi:hypothetical protein
MDGPAAAVKSETLQTEEGIRELKSDSIEDWVYNFCFYGFSVSLLIMRPGVNRIETDVP